jgi:hypothetical protein
MAKEIQLGKISISTRNRRMGKTIQLMKKFEKNFDMNYEFYIPIDGMNRRYTQPLKTVLEADCGASCCIAGFTVTANFPQISRDRINKILDVAQEVLQLDHDLKELLFMNEKVTPEAFRLAAKLPEEHTLYNKDVSVGIKALRQIVAAQNSRDRKELKCLN